MIGHSYFKLTSTEDLSGEIGWSLHPDFEGQGYASESARAMLEYAFGTLGLHRVTAELDPRNTASIALCKRLGMREEAYFREHMWFKGEWGDTGVYAVLASEFSAGRRSVWARWTAPPIEARHTRAIRRPAQLRIALP